MRRFHATALLVALASALAAAQATTADGVQALVRGDYETAAGILKPLAENTPQPDPVAQFFLAAMYDAGRGVARDRFHACALYASAAESSNSPFAPLARDIAEIIREPLTSAALAVQTCVPTNAVPWGDAPSASFTLGRDHWVRLDAGGVTIGFEGAEQHKATVAFRGPGLVWLPFRYSPVDVASPSPARRHFIQAFVWHRTTPDDDSSWSLGWFLDEIVGVEMLPVTGGPRLVTIVAPQPPPAFDTSRLVELRANADGDVEWIVNDPADPRRGVVPRRGVR